MVEGLPRLSETFIAQELLGLERAGFQLHIVSMRRPTDRRCIQCTVKSPLLCSICPNISIMSHCGSFAAWFEQGDCRDYAGPFLRG